MRPALVVPAGADHIPFDRAEIEGSIGARFRKVAQRFPDRPAVREAGRVTTYAELAASARRIARGLTERIAGKPGPVALMGDSGAPLFAAMLGALEAGRFYVPLDPRLPAARLEAILRTLDAAAVVAGQDWLGHARSLVSGEPVWSVAELDAGPPAADPAASVSPDELAYVLFTSGSTGAPKGVMQSHRNVLHNTLKLASGLAIRADDRLTLLSSPSFGASVSDIFGALLTGASVCPYSLAGDGLRRLPEFLTREGITIFHSVPSVFRCFSWTLDGREDLSALRVVKLGGEAVLAPDFELYRNRFPRRCVFHVGLGATEMHVIRQWFADHDTPWPGASPLGHAVDETEVVVLDDAGRPADGEGEIAVLARTLAVGYWKDPAQSAAAFLPVPGRPGVRLYRTGDLGRMLPDGCLLHVGRKGSRLKIRGHRVEIGEVEAALLGVSGIREAVADGRDRPEGMRLVAWLVRETPDRPGIAQVRAALSEVLPAYTVPASFVFLGVLPRTASGKVDRKALPEPDAARPLASAFAAPRNDAEAAAAGVFAQVLGIDGVGADDDFFELGRGFALGGRGSGRALREIRRRGVRGGPAGGSDASRARRPDGAQRTRRAGRPRAHPGRRRPAGLRGSGRRGGRRGSLRRPAPGAPDRRGRALLLFSVRSGAAPLGRRSRGALRPSVARGRPERPVLAGRRLRRRGPRVCDGGATGQRGGADRAARPARYAVPRSRAPVPLPPPAARAPGRTGSPVALPISPGACATTSASCALCRAAGWRTRVG